MKLAYGFLVGALLTAAAVPADAGAQERPRSQPRSAVRDCRAVGGVVTCERVDAGQRQGRAVAVPSRDRDRYDRDRDRYDRYDRDRYDRERHRDRYDRDRRHDRLRYDDFHGGSPKFCRNGTGHPVYGREWCRQQGFGLGEASWQRVRWDDVTFRRPRYDHYDGSLSGAVLGELLGTVVFGRLMDHRRYAGFDGAISGQWNYIDGARILRVFAGGLPMAEFRDLDRDGRVDVVMLNGGI